MKAVLTLMALVMAMPAFAAQKRQVQQTQLRSVICVNHLEDEMTLTPATAEELEKNPFLADDGAVYRVTIAENMSSSYIGAIGLFEDSPARYITIDSEGNTTSDVFTDWDGSSGITFTAPKGAIASGQPFAAQLDVTYSDIEEESVNNDLNCRVQE